MKLRRQQTGQSVSAEHTVVCFITLGKLHHLVKLLPVFCGFGEPTERLETLCETAKLLKARGVKTIRINTNGLSDLIHGRKTAADLKGLVDIVSVSLNAGTEAEYLKVTRPKYGAVAYPAMQQFALDCKQYVPQVMFSVVDILPKPELEAAQQLADRLGIHLRIRQFDDAATRRNG